jgi:hypothetical protein
LDKEREEQQGGRIEQEAVMGRRFPQDELFAQHHLAQGILVLMARQGDQRLHQAVRHRKQVVEHSAVSQQALEGSGVDGRKGTGGKCLQPLGDLARNHR